MNTNDIQTSGDETHIDDALTTDDSRPRGGRANEIRNVLQEEIERTRARISFATSHKASADALFKKS